MKTAIISGATGTIGSAICDAYVAQGYGVTLLVRDKKKCEKKFQHVDINIVSLDLCDQQHVTRAFEAHYACYGISPSVVIHAAATQVPIGLMWEVDSQEWAHTIDVNCVASFLMSRTAIQFAMKDSVACSIVLFSGGGACYARPYFSAYGVSKTAVLRLVETTAEELKLKRLDQQIQINALAPGAVFSNMTHQIIAAEEYIGKDIANEAKNMSTSLNTPGDAVQLCLFLTDREQNGGLNGRLIHAQEPYQTYSKRATDIQKSEQGLLRRVGVQDA